MISEYYQEPSDSSTLYYDEGEWFLRMDVSDDVDRACLWRVMIRLEDVCMRATLTRICNDMDVMRDICNTSTFLQHDMALLHGEGTSVVWHYVEVEDRRHLAEDSSAEPHFKWEDYYYYYYYLYLEGERVHSLHLCEGPVDWLERVQQKS